MFRPFCPSAATKNIDVAASSANVLVANATGQQQIYVFNDGSATAWIAFGTDNNVAATLAAGMPIGSKLGGVITVTDGPIWAAAIAAASTGKIYFTPGSGI
jgi:hypothetical protein